MAGGGARDWRISVFTKSSPKPASSSSIGLAWNVRFRSVRAGMDAGDAIAAAQSHQEATHPATHTDPNIRPHARWTRRSVWCRDSFGNTLIEHLPRGFFSVSADMITGDQIIHRRSVSGAVRASISIPGLILPGCNGERCSSTVGC